jgi:Mrp family chromosome partitioning ATPase
MRRAASIDTCSPGFAKDEAMDFFQDTQQATDVLGAPAPVILPILTRRFAFPAIPPVEATPDSRPGSSQEPACGILWPKCEQPPVVEACAELAATIHGQWTSKQSAVLALTSPGDGDGKTALTVALAPELASRTPGGVLVVDADFGKADLSRRLIQSAGPTDGGPAPSIYPTDQPGLYVRLSPEGPLSEDLSPGCFEEWRRRWPLVLLDCLSLEHTEPGRFLRRCDGVYLVVRLGHTARRAVSEAARVIRACGGRLLGGVVVGETRD